MSEQKSKFFEALVKAQLEIKAPFKDKTNPRFKTKYASIDSINEAIRIPLAKNDLTLSHTIEIIEGKHWLITTLFHVLGDFVSNKMPMFIEQQSSQGFASALTYARRYAIASLLALPTDEDDDAESAESEHKRISKEVVRMNESMCNAIHEWLSLFPDKARYDLIQTYQSRRPELKICKIEDIPAEFGEHIIATLRSRYEASNAKQ